MIHKLLTGAEFNQRYTDKYIKLTNQSEIHNGYQFQTGLNVDIVPFNPKGSCQAGGIYFCSIDKLALWLTYSYDSMCYARFVTIPNDAQVWVEEDKFKADCLILGDRIAIGDLAVWQDAAYNLKACRINGHALQYVKDQTGTICLAAITHDVSALQYVKEQTFEMNLYACRLGCRALQYVRDQTEELILEVYKLAPRYAEPLGFVRESLQTDKICRKAISKNPYALKFVLHQTLELCLLACRLNGRVLQFVKQQTPEICLAAVQQNGHALKFVTEQTQAICMAAVEQDITALSHVRDLVIKMNLVNQLGIEKSDDDIGSF